MPSALVTSPATARLSAVMRSVNSAVASAQSALASICRRSAVMSAMANTAASVSRCGTAASRRRSSSLVPHHRVQQLDLTPGLGLDLAGLGQLRVALG
jgi:hypothetical protein